MPHFGYPLAEDFVIPSPVNTRFDGCPAPKRSPLNAWILTALIIALLFSAPIFVSKNQETPHDETKAGGDQTPVHSAGVPKSH